MSLVRYTLCPFLPGKQGKCAYCEEPIKEGETAILITDVAFPGCMGRFRADKTVLDMEKGQMWHRSCFAGA